MDLHTRSRDKSVMNENARLEVESLVRLEKGMRKKLGLGKPQPDPSRGR
jgi:4-hydroxy-tetrahydrodipicolinate synthase